jgi:hypothetical protein
VGHVPPDQYPFQGKARSKAGEEEDGQGVHGFADAGIAGFAVRMGLT